MADITYDLTTGDGKHIDAFYKIVKARKNELGLTTKNTCIALTINILKSLRADTKVAKTSDKGDISAKCVDSKYYPSWKTVGGRRLSCLRAGKDGNEIKVKKVIWLNDYVKGQILHSYEVTDKVSEQKIVQAIVVASSKDEAIMWMKRKHKNRIQHKKGLAKIALGLSMHEVSQAENVNDPVEELIRNYASKNVEARVTESGFNSGDVSILVHDKLGYATDALKHGEGYVDTAMYKALNKMTGYINHIMHNKGIYDDLAIPFPELQKNTLV